MLHSDRTCSNAGQLIILKFQVEMRSNSTYHDQMCILYWWLNLLSWPFCLSSVFPSVRESIWVLTSGESHYSALVTEIL